MRILLVCLTAVLAIFMMGCSHNPQESETTPPSKMPDATAADNAKKIDSNPNLPESVKKVLGHAGH
jgi:hypothetical protein